MKNLFKKIKLIKATDYLFLIKSLNIKTKIKKEILYFNFKSELFYKYIYYIKKDNVLYIYNSYIKTRFFLPEGLILSYSLKKDGIYVFKNRGYFNILIRKNNVLINDFTLKNPDEKTLNTLKFEHLLEVYRLDYEKSIEEGYKNIDFRDLISLWDLSFDTKKLKEAFYDFTKPFMIASIVFFALLYLYQIYLNSKKEEIQKQYNKIKHEAVTLKKELDKINNSTLKWKILAAKIKDPQSFEVLNTVVAAVKGNGRISYFRLNKNDVLFTVDANDSTNILKNLSSNPIFDDFTLKSEVKIGKNLKRYRFQGTIHETK